MIHYSMNLKDWIGKMRIPSEVQEILKRKIYHEQKAFYLKELLKNHVKYTSSDKGSFLLKDFSNQKHKFVKVMPTDYKKALIMLENEKVKEKVK